MEHSSSGVRAACDIEVDGTCGPYPDYRCHSAKGTASSILTAQLSMKLEDLDLILKEKRLPLLHVAISSSGVRAACDIEVVGTCGPYLIIGATQYKGTTSPIDCRATDGA